MGCSPHVSFSQTQPRRFRSELNNGDLNTALNDSRTDGVAGEARGVVDVQLRHEMLPVFVHGLEAYAQFGGDLFVGLAFGNELEHFHLARTQAVAASLLELSRSIKRLPIAT